MDIVEIRVADEARLRGLMVAMREWLDHRRYEPATFRYDFGSSVVRCRIEFAERAAAEQFAQAFDGRLIAGLAAAQVVAP